MGKKRNLDPAILDVVAVRASVARAVSDYYDGLSAEEVEEQSEWGDFALRQFPEESERASAGPAPNPTLCSKSRNHLDSRE